MNPGSVRLNPPGGRSVHPIVQPAPAPLPDLADGLRAGDRAAFSAIVREHQRGIFFHVLRMVRRDEPLARDLVQKVFLQAWAKRESFRGDASLKTWLLRIATNLTLNELRRAHRHREEAVESGGDDVAASDAVDAFDQLEVARQREQLAEAVQTLPPKQRAVVLLRLYEDLAFPEIGDVLGITANNAKVHFHHATKTIKRQLAQRGAA